MPNTNPVIDNALGVEYVNSRARAVGKCRVHVAGACSQGLKGETLSEMGDMIAHGAVAFTDDGHGVQDAGMMRRVMDYANQFDTVIMAHCQDDLARRRPGQRGRRLHAPGHGRLACRGRGARDRSRHRAVPPDGLPAAHPASSTARGLELVRAAKAEGCPSPAR